MKSYQETAYLLYWDESVSALERINSENWRFGEEEDLEEEEENLKNLNSSYRLQKFSNKFLQFFNSQFDSSM